jgi:hypothetical protein
MNSNIKNLVEKAKLKCYDENEIAKFAELLIRECADFIDPTSKKVMFKHFGIK